jgi:hypothetical protein
MAFYCAACGKEIPNGKEVLARDDGRVQAGGRPRHAECVPGYREPEPGDDFQAQTRVTCIEGRLVCQRLGAEGGVEGWLELPASLKQPLMAMVSEVARGRERVDYPVPGGDSLVVSREGTAGSISSLHLRREPTGFPPQGRAVAIPGAAVDLFLVQCRSV